MAVQSLYRDAQTGKVYLELFRELHWIKNSDTLTRTFGSNPSISDDMPPYEQGFEIGEGSCLVWSGPKMYLYVASYPIPSQGTAFWITTPDVVKHYQFNGTQYPVNAGDKILAEDLIQIAQKGPDIT